MEFSHVYKDESTIFFKGMANDEEFKNMEN